jgi:hypothetical protein
MFSRAEVAANLKEFHTPLCPVYALNSALASGDSIPKWDNRCRLGINLGTSPRYAINVYLVLNLTTGLSSPQFHLNMMNSLRQWLPGLEPLTLSPTGSL